MDKDQAWRRVSVYPVCFIGYRSACGDLTQSIALHEDERGVLAVIAEGDPQIELMLLRWGYVSSPLNPMVKLTVDSLRQEQGGLVNPATIPLQLPSGAR